MIWKNGTIEKGSLDRYPTSGEKGLIYEVIRVINYTPVFLPEHLQRFWSGCNKIGVIPEFSEQELITGFLEVIKENKLSEGNLRLQTELDNNNTKIGIIPHHYPSIQDYQNGVAVDLVRLQRNNPNIKSWNLDVRAFADEYIRKNNVYEVILTTEEGFLLEGSRSNIFGMKKGVLITPPADYVLPGITRQKIIELAEKISMPFQEKPIHKEDIFSFQSFFLSGTSPGILPIRRINNFHFNCDSSPCNNLVQAYNQEISNSINNAIYRK